MHRPAIHSLWAIAALALAGCTDDALAPQPAQKNEEFTAPLFARGDTDTEYKDRYIVVLNEHIVRTRAQVQEVADQYSRHVRHVYSHALKGFASVIEPSQVEQLRRDSRVKYIHSDAEGHDTATDTNAGWGLGRIDQQFGPSDGQFTSSYTGQGVNIYIVDGGVNGLHPDMSGRVYASATWNAAYPANQDCSCLVPQFDEALWEA